ncbi:MAG: hypothetical protein LBK60_09920 [Verrucomicrobiales bacterium]|jgi:hypothetical protein|nr:hypothetical protein [Verrucomicrobiales bacterium]
MSNQPHNINRFSTKKYIEKTWAGISDFFTKYTAALPAMRERLGLPPAELTLLTDALTTYNQYNALIAELETVLKITRDARYLLVAEKDTTTVPVPDTQRLQALIAQLAPTRGGMLYLEDKLTSAILHNPLHTPLDLEQLGINYQPTPKPDPAKSVGRIYLLFTGGIVNLHWILPRGISDARLSRSIDHGPPVIIYQGSDNSFIDRHPIPAKAQVWAYTLEPLLHGELYGKPITEKIIVGSDIVIEEEKI